MYIYIFFFVFFSIVVYLYHRILNRVPCANQFLFLAFNLDYYTEVLDLSYLLDHLASDPFFRHYRQLNEKLVQLIEDYSLVSFIPLNIQVQPYFFFFLSLFWTCCATCGIPNQGLNLGLGQWKLRVLTADRQTLRTSHFFLQFTLLYFTAAFFFFLTNCRFVAILHLTSVCSNSICSLYVSMSHFDDSHNVLSMFIIIIFVMMICDQGSLMLLSTIVWGTINYTHLRQWT